MSNLNMLPIGAFKEIFKLTAFVETGTESGAGVDTALRAGFKNVYSCEIQNRRYLAAVDRFKDNKDVCLLEGPSKLALPLILVMAEKDKILYWLDAHLPNWGSPDIDYPLEQILPLIDELEIIAERDNSRDVLMIDDLRIFDKKYRRDTFDLQHWVGNKGVRDISIESIKKMFPNHAFYIDVRAEEVLMGLPLKAADIKIDAMIDSITNFKRKGLWKSA